MVEGGVVPFIGAGVSYGATTEPGGDCIARTDYMVKKLMIMNGICNGKCLPCNKEDCTREFPLGVLAEKYLWAKSAEGVGVRPYTSLVRDVLSINDFAKLRPLPAHRYIACLAREGCIREVITSNYDTCLSTAFKESFFRGPFSIPLDSVVNEVVDLLTYRKYAGPKRHGANGMALRIVHINGCAKCLDDACPDRTDSDDALEAHCKGIMLTESQLQDWRQRHWGRDMFKDRLRSRNILFSGFGSPEPQVRHTVMQVIEEFQPMPLNAEMSKEQIWGAPNAPYIHAYESDLTFEQRQIICAFAQANAGQLPKYGHHPNGNCFTGGDMGFFLEGIGQPAESEAKQLPADVFWHAVYTAAFWRLLDSHFGRGSPFRYFVDSMIPCADAIMQKLRSWLLPRDPSDGEFIFGRFPELFRLEDDSTILSRHVWNMRYRGSAMQKGWYSALSDKCILMPTYFLIMHLLYGDGLDEGRIKLHDIVASDKCEEGLGLRFRMSCGRAGRTILVCPIHEESGFQYAERLQTSEDLSRVSTVVQVVIGDFPQAKSLHLWCERQVGDERVRYVPCYQVALRQLLSRDSPPAPNQRPLQVEDVATLFQRNIKACTQMVDQERTRVHAFAIPLRKERRAI